MKKLEHFDDAFRLALELGSEAFQDAHASVRLLQLLGTTLNCEWGTLWIVDGAKHQLCPFATWSVESGEAPLLERHTRSRNLSLSEGNAGHVWRSRKPIWTVDLIRDMCIPRSLDAVAAGLRGGIWFAVQTEGDVYGVIELLGRDVPPPTIELLAGVEILGVRLGEGLRTVR